MSHITSLHQRLLYTDPASIKQTLITFSCAHKGKKMTTHTCLEEMVLSLSSHKCETRTSVSFTGDCGQILLPLPKGGETVSTVLS